MGGYSRRGSRVVLRMGRRRGERRGYYGGYVYLPPYFYPGESPAYEPPPPPERPPVRVVVKRPAPPPAPPPASLLLEFRDGRWVRVPTGENTPPGPLAVQPIDLQPSAAKSIPQSAAPILRPRPLPDAVLVFRNGRRQLVKRYVIRGSAIYASEDYWTTGSWSKRIPISELNVPATLKLNQERGSKFRLPSAPNEIVVRF